MILERPLFGKVDIQARLITEHAETVIYSQNFETSASGWTAGTDDLVNQTWFGAGNNYGHGSSVYMLSSRVPASPYTGQVQALRTFTGLTIGKVYTARAWCGRASSTATVAMAKIGIAGIGYGTPLTPLQISGGTVANWREVTYTFTASATSHQLILEHTSSATSAGNTTVYWDDVTLTANAWTESTWTDLTADATSLSIRRGGARDGIAVRTDVGLATFTLKNAQDPMAGGKLRPGLDARVLADGDPIFTGRIAHLNSLYPLNKQSGESRAVIQVTVADAVQIHGSTTRYGVQIAGGFETFEERIGRLASSAQAPVEVPLIGDPIPRYEF